MTDKTEMDKKHTEMMKALEKHVAELGGGNMMDTVNVILNVVVWCALNLKANAIDDPLALRWAILEAVQRAEDDLASDNYQVSSEGRDILDELLNNKKGA